MGTINTMLTLDGESGFRRSITNINTQLKSFEAELKSVSSQYGEGEKAIARQMDINGKLANIYNTLKEKETILKDATAKMHQEFSNSQQKMTLLRSESEKLRQKHSDMQKEIERLTWNYGENDTAVINLKVDLQRLEEEQRQNQKEITKTEKSMQAQYNSYHRYRRELADTTDQLHVYSQRSEEGRQKLEQLKSETEEAEKKTSHFKVTLEDVKKTLQAVGTVVSATGSALAKVAQVEMAALSTSVQAISKEFEIAAQGFGAYTETFVKGLQKIGQFSYNSGATFEESMSKVKAYSQASAEEMTELEKAARDMGATTSRSASESADALGALALNGFKVDEMLGSLKPVVKASEAGQMDLATTAKYAASVMRAYGKEVSDLEPMLNIMVDTQNRSGTSLEDLMGAYTNSAAMFKTLNVDMAESASILGVLANRGFVGTEIGNNLNSILINLIGVNEKAETAMTELGVSAWDSEGNFRGLANTLKDLNARLESGTDQEKAMIEAAIGGKRQYKTLEAMLAGVANEYDELYESTSHAFENEVLYSTAETMMDNLKGDVRILASAFESLGISIFQTFSVDLRNAVEQASEWVSRLKDAVEDGNVESVFVMISHQFRAFMFDAIDKMAKELPGALKLYNTSIITGIQVIISMARKAMVSLLPTMMAGFVDLVMQLIGQLPEIASTLVDVAAEFFGGIAEGFQQILPELQEVIPVLIETLANAFKYNVPMLFTIGADLLIGIVEAIVENISIIVEAMEHIVLKLASAIQDYLPRLMEIGATLLTELLNGIVESLPIVIETGLMVLMAVIQGITDNSAEIMQTAFDILMMLIDGILENLPVLLECAFVIIDNLVNFIVNNLSELTRAALQILVYLTKFLVEHIDEVMMFVPELLNAILHAVIDNADLILEAAVEILVALAEGLVAAFPVVIETIGTITELIKGLFGKGEFMDIGANIIMGIAEGIKAGFEGFVDLVGDVKDSIVGFFKNGFDIHSPSRLMKKEIGENIGAGIVEGISDGMDLSGVQLSEFQADMKAASANISIEPAYAGNETIEVSFYGDINLNNLTDDIDSFIETIDGRVASYRMAKGRA